MNNLDTVFGDIDNFCQTFPPAWEKYLISVGVKQRKKPSRLSVSEVMTIVITFHQSGYRDFKTYYIHFTLTSLTIRQGRQRLPSLIHPSYMFITIYAFSEISFPVLDVA
ncbi:hypothetical protein BTN49_1170 [Candidatus Enterovibrio escicola]|uniref:Mobile element protein n=1 Tax=Candidatus Enterovibrio escicola TaxID=1927127 RepID=A0A2A5T4U5_9GAMM|nr:hypothetical protein [Candidatus Enterovibrio escacola]PCS23174.1 hypothetical protein BTN49_1170 [Candidatus Enterovibrio escacola]